MIRNLVFFFINNFLSKNIQGTLNKNKIMKVKKYGKERTLSLLRQAL